MYAMLLVCLMGQSQYEPPRDQVDRMYDGLYDGLTPEGQARRSQHAAQLRQARALERQATAMESIPIALMPPAEPWYQSSGVLIAGAIVVVGVFGVLVIRGTLKKT